MPIGDLLTGTSGAATVQRGQRKLSDVAAARQVLQVDPKLLYVSEDVAPLYAYFTKIKKTKKVNNPTWYWYETDYLPKEVTTNGTTTAAGTTLTVVSPQANRCNVGTLLKVQRTGEVMRVTAVNSGTSLTVVRGVGGTSGAATQSGEEILILSFAAAEGVVSQSGIQSEPPAPKFNVTQTIRQPIELSGRELQLETYGGDEKARIIKDAREFFYQQIETMILCSNARDNTGDPTISAGADFYISTNLTNVGGTLTEATLNDNFIIPWYRRNNSKKSMMVMAGEKFCRALDIFGRDNIRYDTSDTGIGIKVMKYRSNFGEIEIFRHGAMTPQGYTAVSAANLGLQGMAYGINMDLCQLVQLGDRGMKLRVGNPETGIAAPDTDGWKSEFIADLGLEFKSETQHAKLTGITG